ncbi:hypothetical protein [Streptomyces roseochromogenus]|uniref:Uncharacterized protein n=1 Tax=Streptomyces roseochromogenus subsp. oscitans DS 12.976 TaxID=1352936 RepID=V6JE01_STRRC|nr:hypothetical protein [Streptomyces roseochromogenus]EST18060.1 hypothetical protein M878_45695 [Streptomyces roseochromogenus subsp. oscitans DS 12.976]
MAATKKNNGAPAEILALATKLTDEALSIAWMATEGVAPSEEMAVTRGWLMDELHKRLGDDLFDEWLMAVDENGDGLDPLPFLERHCAPTARPCEGCLADAGEECLPGCLALEQ